MNFSVNIIALLFLGALAVAPPSNEGAVGEGKEGSRFYTDVVVPFGVGERIDYQVRLAGVSVGRGSLEVPAVEPVQGHPSFHTRMKVSGGIPFARVDDTFESWIDVERIFSRRFHQDQKEIRYERRREFDFFPEERWWRRSDTGETGDLPTSEPLDDLSFIYFARTLPLRVGDTYTLPRYFKEEGNPVILRVIRREKITVPAGTFESVVVRPVIRTKGLFGEGGEAEVYFTDDERRIPVMIRSKVPVVGSLTMQMTAYRPGQRHPAAGNALDAWNRPQK